MDDDRWTRLKAEFAAALDLDGPERDRRLGEVRAEDPELGRRLAALLDGHARADAVLERVTRSILGAPEASPTPGDPHTTPEPPNLSGHDIDGRFRLLDRLGSGGMGVVYRAEDLRLQRTVALKFLRPEDAGAEVTQERFLREARAASRLDHPNICPIYEVGDSPEAGPFLVMPCYTGESLEQVLSRSGPLPVREAVGIARQMLRGLEAAHDAGVVHCDLKPGNLLVAADGTVKILDFGLARLREPARSVPGGRSGTVAYMSPEQLRGEELDVRTDLWSAGAVLYEMLTGRQPFGARNDLPTIYTILHSDPTRPSALNPPLPAPLDEVCARLLGKTREDRPASAAEVLRELETVLPDQPSRDPRAPAVVAPPVTSATDEPVSLAVLPLRYLGADRDRVFLSDGITDEIIGRLSKVEGLRVTGRDSSFRFRDRSTELSEVGHRLGVTHVLDGTLREAGDQVRIGVELVRADTGERVWTDAYERAAGDIFTLEDEIGRAVTEALRLHLASRGVDAVTAPPPPADARESFLRGRFFAHRRTEEGLARAEAFHRRAIAADPSFARAHAALAETLVAPRISAPGERFRVARASARRALGLDPSLAEGHTVMGWIAMWYDRDWTAAEDHFRRALLSRPGYLWAHQWHSAYLAAVGRVEEALGAMRRAHRLDPLSLPTLTHLGSQLFWLGRYEEAAEQYHRALALDPGFFMARWGLGRVRLRMDRVDAAIREFRHPGTDLVGFFQPGLLGHALAVSGRDAEARAVLGELEGRMNRGAYVAPTDVAAIHIGLGEYERALQWLARHERDRGARIFLLADPMFDPVRDDPDFDRLLRSVRLPLPSE